MNKNIFVILFFALMMSPTIVVAQEESDTTTWYDNYQFRKIITQDEVVADYTFTYDAPYDRAAGKAGYVVSSAELEKVYLDAHGPIGSWSFVVDIIVLFPDLNQQYSFPNMVNGEQEVINIFVDYESTDSEQCSVIVTPKYESPYGDEIGASLVFVWKLGWQRGIGLPAFEIFILACIGFSILLIVKMREH